MTCQTCEGTGRVDFEIDDKLLIKNGAHCYDCSLSIKVCNCTMCNLDRCEELPMNIF